VDSRVFIGGFWLQYLQVAREGRDSAVAAVAVNPDTIHSGHIIAIVFSALTVEAFINELMEAADVDAEQRERYGMASPVLDTLGDLASILGAIEADRGSLALKYQMARKVLTGHTFSKGEAPFQSFSKLVALRDLLVHARPRDGVDAVGNVLPKSPLLRNFRQRGWTRTRAPKPGERVPGMAWNLDIQTDKMAAWAYTTACGIIQALGAEIPIGDIGMAPATATMKEQSQALPS
jgi:hypothetical protein